MPDVAAQIAGDLPLNAETVLVRTTRPGLHIALATAKPFPSQTLYLSDGRKLGELKAAGAYVVVPPSTIGTKAYEVISLAGNEPLLVEDPVTWLRELLPCFDYQLADKPPGRDYEHLGGVIHEGEGRHNALVSYAGKVWVDGMAGDTLLKLLCVMNEEQCLPPLEFDEVSAIADHFVTRRERRSSAYEVRPPGAGPQTSGGFPELRPFPRTDSGNAELFAALHADAVRYDHRRHHWFIWRGHWWAEDEDGEVDVGSAVAAFLAGLLTGNGTNFDMLAQQQARAARDVTEGEWGRRRALLRNSMQVQD